MRCHDAARPAAGCAARRRRPPGRRPAWFLPASRCGRDRSMRTPALPPMSDASAPGSRLRPAPVPWRVIVLDDPNPNAFALPDRRVLVTRGMLALAEDEAEVAAVLAHEIAHVTWPATASPAPRAARRRRRGRPDSACGFLAAAGYDPQRAGRPPGDADRRPCPRRPAARRGDASAGPQLCPGAR